MHVVRVGVLLFSCFLVLVVVGGGGGGGGGDSPQGCPQPFERLFHEIVLAATPTKCPASAVTHGGLFWGVIPSHGSSHSKS